MSTRRVRPWVALASGLVLAVVATAGAEEAAAIATQKGQWEMSYGAVYYRVFGEVENKSKKPLQYVKLQLDLLDEDGKSVYSTIAYNQKAEVLGDVEGEGADTLKAESPAEKLARVQPLKPGEKDLFRIGVSKDDMPKKPKFQSYGLKIVETK